MAGQLVHELEPDSEYCPEVQAVMALGVMVHAYPGGHSWHCIQPASEKRPAVHAAGEPVVVAQALPAGHWVHDDADPVA